MSKTCSLIGLAVVSAALVLALSACSGVPQIAAASSLYKRDVSQPLSDIAPVRGPLRPLRLHRDGDEIECTTCHDTFTGDQNEEALKDEHKDLDFNHGRNQRCLNCHNAKNSMVYANYDGSEIPDTEPHLLCAKCHGQWYREWLMGIHGRINGYWNVPAEKQAKIECIQCHNPHHPKFQPLTPEPPPVLTRFDARPPLATAPPQEESQHGQ